MNDDKVLSRGREDARATQVRNLGVPTVNLDRALQVAGDLEDGEIAHAMGVGSRGAILGRAECEAGDL